MRILFLYFNYDLRNVLIPIYISKTFEDLGHQVKRAGRSGKNGPELDFEFDSPQVTLEEIFRKTGSKYDFIFFFHPNPNFYITDIEKSPIPTVLYTIDTFVPFVKEIMKGYALLFDYVYCSQTDFVSVLKKEGFKNAYWSPYAIYPKIHNYHHLKKKYPVVFLGGHNALHNPRRALYLKIISITSGLKVLNNFYFDKLAKVYSRSKIVFNIPSMYDLNPRVFESLACGTLVITPKTQVGRQLLLKENVHLVTFKNIFDAILKTKYYLKNDLEREKIARAGYLEVHKNHTYEKRVKEIISKIKKTKSPIKIYSSSQAFKIAKSFYLLGTKEQSLFWLKKAFNKSVTTRDKIKSFIFLKLISMCPNQIINKFRTLYGKQAGLRTIIWQFRNF